MDFCDINNGGKNVAAGETAHSAQANNWSSVENQYPSNPPDPTAYTPDAFFVTYPESSGQHPFYTTITEY